jgi:hypothetical protein
MTPQVLTIFILPQLFLSDPGTNFSQSIGWTTGERTARYAIVVDHGKVIYAEKEPGRDVTVSSLDIEATSALTFANIRFQAPKQSWLRFERSNSNPGTKKSCQGELC